MGVPETKEKTYEDWVAVMRDLLEGNLEQQASAYAKLNRQITIFLRGWNARQYAAEWEDLRQEAVIKLTERFRKPPLPDPSAFFSYFRIVTQNVLIDRVRKERGIVISNKDLEADEEDPLARIPVPPGVNDATRILLRNCLGKLPDYLRQVAGIYFFKDRPLEVAAQETGVSLATFKRRLQNARELLIHCLGGTSAE